MAYWDSNGHVTDDVTWPIKVKVMTQIYLGPIISKTAGDTDLVPMEHLEEMTTWESNGHQYAYGEISRKRLEIRDLYPKHHQ